MIGKQVDGHKHRTRQSTNPVDKVFSEIEAWRSGRLWGAKRIAKIAGVGADTIPRWADLPDCPIKRVGGRYFVVRDALIDWLTVKNA